MTVTTSDSETRHLSFFFVTQVKTQHFCQGATFPGNLWERWSPSKTNDWNVMRRLPSVSRNNVGGLSIFMSAVITQLSAESLKHFFPLSLDFSRTVHVPRSGRAVDDRRFHSLFFNPKYKPVFLAETLHSLRVFKLHLPERQQEPSGSATLF